MPRGRAALAKARVCGGQACGGDLLLEIGGTEGMIDWTAAAISFPVWVIVGRLRIARAGTVMARATPCRHHGNSCGHPCHRLLLSLPMRWDAPS